MEISVAQYGKSIGKSRFTVYRMIDDGKLPKGVKSKNVAGRIVIVVKGKKS